MCLTGEPSQKLCSVSVRVNSLYAVLVGTISIVGVSESWPFVCSFCCQCSWPTPLCASCLLVSELTRRHKKEAARKHSLRERGKKKKRNEKVSGDQIFVPPAFISCQASPEQKAVIILELYMYLRCMDLSSCRCFSRCLN